MKFKYIALTAAVALTSMTSCNDFLDKAPDTRVELQDVEQLRELMVDGYNQYDYSTVCELSSDNVIDNNSPSDKGVRYNLAPYDVMDNELFAWEDVKSSTDANSPSAQWNGCYAAIASCNAVLEAADRIEAQGGLSTDDAAKLRAVRGEALVSRAYHHFVLTNIFCMPYRGDELSQKDLGIPYITKPETKLDVKYNRGTVKQDYDSIERDLKAGLPLINDGIYEVPKYHFNKQAAYAFAARFFLFKRDYPQVVAYADSAFSGQDPAKLMSNIWSQTSFYYIKDISLYNTRIARPNNFLLFATYSQWPRRLSSSYRYTCNRDAKRATIQGPGPSWKDNIFTSSTTKESFAMNSCFRSVLGSSGGSEYGAYFAGNAGEQFEYTDKVSGIGYTHNVRAEFTAEETILCRAEAKLFMGDIEGCFEDLKIWDDARQDNTDKGSSAMKPLTRQLIERFYDRENDPGYGIIKDVHVDEVCPSEKYHVTAEIEPYLQCVLHYRRIQNVHNGMRWFDIKRMGLSITHNIGTQGNKTLESLDSRYAIQIPTEVLSTGFTPNPRYEAPKSPVKSDPNKVCLKFDLISLFNK